MVQLVHRDLPDSKFIQGNELKVKLAPLQEESGSSLEGYEIK